MNIILPYPPRELMPNRKLHWGPKHKVAKKHFGDCYFSAIAQGVKVWKERTRVKNFKLEVSFNIPKGRKPDLDNINAAMKWGYDGLAKAMGINDARFTTMQLGFSNVFDDKCVVVTLREAV